MESHTVTELDINTVLPWGKSKRIDTRNGPRDVSKCILKPDEEYTGKFWALWRNAEFKKQLVIAGVSVGKEWSNGNRDREGANWEATWWKLPPKEELQRLETSMESSGAIDAPADLIIPCPDGLAYLGYQRGGIAYALQRPGTLFGDDMGLGKTIQAIGFINARPDIEKFVVVCPASVKINWYRELKKWLTRPFTIRIAEPSYWPTAQGVIINYDILHRFADRLAEPIDCAIADEAQFIKNEKTKRGQAMLAMGAAARYRLALTGTPMENDEAEVFTIAQFCDPKEYNNRFMFMRKYTGSAENRNKCQRKLRSTIMVRRLKSEVLKDLPPKFRTVIEVPYTDEDLKQFELIATRGVDWDRLEELKAALELAKASDNFADYENAVEALKEGVSTKFEMMSELRHRTAQAALPYCIDHLRNVFESGVTKVIFFSHHRDINDAIHAAFPGSVQHYGGMSDAAKQEAVDKFQLDEHCPLFSGSIRASGVGLTLTAASRVVFGEPDWVPGRMTQAEDRAHRIGQTDNVNVDLLVLEGSFFATMAKRIVEKQVAIDQALDEDRTMLMQEPIVVIPTYKPKAPKPISASRAEMIERSATMSPSTIAAVHECLKRLAGVCDGAFALDDMGFNGCDSRIGKSLANQPRLTPLQATLGQKLVRKYKRQLGEQLLEAALSGSRAKDENE